MVAKRKIARKDTIDTYGIRGTGATSQAQFGQTISVEDLLVSVKREPAAYRAVFTVAHDIFAKWFKVVDKSEKADEDFDAKVQKVLDALNARQVFTQAGVFERLFGWSIIALTYVDYGKGIEKPVENPHEILNLSPYCLLSVDVQECDEEKNQKSPRCGLPVYYTLNRSGAAQAKVHYSRMIHLATRLLDHKYKGLTVLDSMYDDLTVFRNIRWGMGQTMFRIGGGFPDVEVEGASKKQLDDLEASGQFKSLQARTYFLHSDKTKLEFKGAAGKALNPEPYVNSCMEQLSMASGMPAAIMRGAQAGALAGSDVNEREYFKFISDLQASFEPYLWDLIDRLMETRQIPTVEDYEIVWNGGFELNELDRTSAALNKAQAEQVYSGWLTVDELRARMDPPLEPLPDGKGNVVLGLKKAESQPFGESPGGVSVSKADMALNPFRKFSNWIKRKFGRKDMLSEIIAAYLKEQLPPERDYAVGTYYPGELPFCLRAEYFRYTQPKQTPADREQLFGVGFLWQSCVQEALDNSNVNVLAANKIRKLKVPNSDLVLVCQPDFEVDVDGKKLILELKSVAGLGKFTQPMREHVLQVTPYIQVCKADSALIVYLNKQTGEVKEFPVQFEEENLTLVFERAKRLDQFLRDKQLPPKCGPGQDWQCKTCEYQTECETFRNDSNEVKK